MSILESMLTFLEIKKSTRSFKFEAKIRKLVSPTNFFKKKNFVPCLQETGQRPAQRVNPGRDRRPHPLSNIKGVMEKKHGVMKS